MTTPKPPKRPRAPRKDTLAAYGEEVWTEMQAERAERIAAGWTPHHH